MEINVCSFKDFENMSGLINKCYYVILSKEDAVVASTGPAAAASTGPNILGVGTSTASPQLPQPQLPQPLQGNTAALREARKRAFASSTSGGARTIGEITADLNNIEKDQGKRGKYIFFFKLDISESNNDNNKQIFQDICGGYKIGEGDYVMSANSFTGAKSYYIVKKTLVGTDLKRICFVKPINQNTLEEIPGQNIVQKQAEELQALKTQITPGTIAQLSKILGYKPLRQSIEIPLKPIKYINGLLIDLDNFDTMLTSNDPTIFDFIQKLYEYVNEKYGENGQLLSSLLQKSIKTKSLDKLLFLLLNKAEFNIFGNKDFAKQEGRTVSDAQRVGDSLKDQIENDIPKKIYLKIFLQIMFKIIYSGNNAAYSFAKITNITRNQCTLVTNEQRVNPATNDTENIQIETDNVNLYENVYDEMLNEDFDSIKKASTISMNYENKIRYILKFFENSEIGSYTGCEEIEYFNKFKTELLTLLTMITSEIAYKTSGEQNQKKTAQKLADLVNTTFGNSSSSARGQQRPGAQPGSSTAAPGSSTAAPGSSTAAPGSSTAAPGSSTSAPGSSTAAPGSSTAAPGSSTAAPGSSTAAPGTNPPLGAPLVPPGANPVANPPPPSPPGSNPPQGATTVIGGNDKKYKKKTIAKKNKSKKNKSKKNKNI